MSEKYRLILDTETANGLAFPLPYDFSYRIVRGKELTEVVSRQFVIREIFLDHELMDTAYYVEKCPEYWRRIWEKRATLTTMYKARAQFLEDCKRYRVRELYAYNMAFDFRALNNLMKRLTDGKYHRFFPKEFKICCIWNMASDAFLATKKYYDFAIANNWLSEKGNLLTNAECAYNYITGNVEFSEVHIGIDDVAIETDILRYCLTRHKKMDTTPKGGIWQKCQKYNRKSA